MEAGWGVGNTECLLGLQSYNRVEVILLAVLSSQREDVVTYQGSVQRAWVLEPGIPYLECPLCL